MFFWKKYWWKNIRNFLFFFYWRTDSIQNSWKRNSEENTKTIRKPIFCTLIMFKSKLTCNRQNKRRDYRKRKETSPHKCCSMCYLTCTSHCTYVDVWFIKLNSLHGSNVWNSLRWSEHLNQPNFQSWKRSYWSVNSVLEDLTKQWWTGFFDAVKKVISSNNSKKSFKMMPLNIKVWKFWIGKKVILEHPC